MSINRDKRGEKVWDTYFGNLNKTVKITSMKSRNRKPLYSMWKIDTLHLNQSVESMKKPSWLSDEILTEIKERDRLKKELSKRGESKECLLMLLEAK